MRKRVSQTPLKVEPIGLCKGEGRDSHGIVHKAIPRDKSGLFLRAACQPDWLNIGTLETGIKGRCTVCFPEQSVYVAHYLQDLPSMELPEFEQPTKTLDEILRKTTFTRRKLS